MIDALVKVSEKLAELLEYRAKRRRETYAELVAPVYEDLQKAHAAYIAMFERCIERLESYGTPLMEVAATFATERREHETMRRDISAKAKVFATGDFDEAYCAFFAAVSDYLEAPRSEALGARTTTLTDLMANGRSRSSASVLLAMHLREAIHKSEVEQIVAIGSAAVREFDVRNETRAVATHMLEAVRVKWETVAAAHANARLHSVP